MSEMPSPNQPASIDSQAESSASINTAQAPLTVATLDFWQRLLARTQTPSGIVSIVQSLVIVILLIVLIVQGVRFGRLTTKQTALETQLTELDEANQDKDAKWQAQLTALEAKIAYSQDALGNLSLTPSPDAQTKYSLVMAQIDIATQELARVQWQTDTAKPTIKPNPLEKKAGQKTEKKTAQNSNNKEDSKALRTAGIGAQIESNLDAANSLGLGLWTGFKSLAQDYLGDLVRIQPIASVHGALQSPEQLAIARSEMVQLLYFSRLALLVGQPELALQNLGQAVNSANLVLLQSNKQHAKTLQALQRAQSMLLSQLRARAS